MQAEFEDFRLIPLAAVQHPTLKHRVWVLETVGLRQLNLEHLVCCVSVS